MERPWWHEAVVYQIYPRSFMDSNGDGIGDLDGVTARLDYLSWLGVDVIWLCPIFRSPNDDNGYDISDYQGIMAEFGTMADFDRLLAEAHRRGMRVILDLVLNHTSDEHPWFIESRSSRDNPKRDWYVWRDGRNGREPNNWASIFEGSAWKLDPATGQYFLHLFSERQPDLNWENPSLRQAMYDMVRWWLDKGIDGFRIDAISHLKKAPGLPDLPNPHRLRYVPSYDMHMNQPGVLDFVDELSRETFQRYDIMTVGEANGVSPAQAVEWVGGEHRRLSMILQFEHWTLWSRDPHAGLDVVALKRIFGRWQRTLHERGWNALYLENHDLPRVVSRWGDPQRFRYESATALATMYFLMEGTPFIYQGQELGMANTVFHSLAEFDDVFARNRIAQMRAEGRDDSDILAELALAARDNSRTPMPWDDSANAGFSSAEPWLRINPEYRAVNVAAQRKADRSVLHFYRRLIALRAAEPALIHGRYDLLLERNRQIYAYTRTLGDRGFLIMCNLTSREARYRHRHLPLRHDALALANQEVPAHPVVMQCVLRPFEARVYRIDPT
ncbi:alpha-glucosidase [Thauera sp. 2A1]|uniref:glycoside hydrolase family 13 protein n=1 Tax=Thauera sp. 2A1 TaxID=2570191 RepID=UPI001291D945|nr:alpha-glucosidase [Thauera sp. 2A1]KAI5914961.1 alpha-glucosidase [Thauera sp. 2A1]